MLSYSKKALQDRKWTWPIGVWKSDFTKIKDTNGVDSYMFVRFLRMMVTFFGPVWFISWAVLLPVDGVSSGLGNEGLERFTFGNIGTEKQGRYWAHLVCAWVFTGMDFQPTNLGGDYSSVLIIICVHSMDVLPHLKRNDALLRYTASSSR